MSFFQTHQTLAKGAAAVAVAAGLCAALAGGLAARADSIPLAAPAPVLNPPDSAPSETIVLSGGCFWGLQGVYEHVKGVTKVYAGYSGGAADTASYETVSTGQTGHAESVQITYDPHVVSYGQLLQIYFSVATDPTELNYQGPDTGTQYRSEIWVNTPAQKQVADAYIAQLTASHTFPSPIVVQVAQAKPFYQAEAYHQDFLVHNPDYPYIAFNDIPKVQALQRLFPALYNPTPITVSPQS